MAGLTNCIIYLFGFPGTGKYTVAKEICAQENVRLVDNHLINTPIFSILHQDGKTKLSPRTWQNCKKVWEAVFDTIIHVAPPEYNYVLTNALYQSNEGDHQWFKEVTDKAAEKNALFIPVRLTCSVEEMTRRIVSPERKTRMKMTDPSAPARFAAADDVLRVTHENLLELDVTNIPPAQTAETILNHARSLS